MEIAYEIDKGAAVQSFLQNASISSYLYSTFTTYDDSFPGLEFVNVTLKELPYVGAKGQKSATLVINDVTKTLTIQIPFIIYSGSKHETYPTPTDVIDKIVLIMQKSVKAYQEYVIDPTRSIQDLFLLAKVH
jgi:hypothetical protein